MIYAQEDQQYRYTYAGCWRDGEDRPLYFAECGCKNIYRLLADVCMGSRLSTDIAWAWYNGGGE